MTDSKDCVGVVSFVTLGCAKNEVDTDKMMRRLSEARYGISSDPGKADIVVVNTCSFIQSATEESIEAILELSEMDSVVAGQTKIVVSGCMPARYGDELERELVEASSFVPCAQEDNIVAVADSLLGVERMTSRGIAYSASSVPSERPWAYVKISDGCDRFCSYCTIPFIRGRYHSFSYEEISSEVASRVEEGAREIVLIAQDTGRWGRDLEPAGSLAGLLSRLCEQFPQTWFRVLYIQPEGVSDELIAAIANHPNACAYFDIPFQHCNADVLASMNRRGNARDFISLAEKIRASIPDATLRTTLIAGYPGETEEQFEELCDFVDEIAFDYVGVFAYSREEGTVAHDLDNQVDDDEKAYRAQVLRDRADAVSAPVIASRIGKTMEVLVCGAEEDGQLFGRAMCQAPDVDGVTYLDEGVRGEVLSVVIDDVLLYEMEGTVRR